MAIVRTKGVDRATKLSKGSKVVQSARLHLTDRLLRYKSSSAKMAGKI
ncbi:hypothetical protein [Thermoactinomyces mirandus]|nr:hypothetical protein [Thermoactinomyces mirandus]